MTIYYKPGEKSLYQDIKFLLIDAIPEVNNFSQLEKFLLKSKFQDLFGPTSNFQTIIGIVKKERERAKIE